MEITSGMSSKSRINNCILYHDHSYTALGPRFIVVFRLVSYETFTS